METVNTDNEIQVIQPEEVQQISKGNFIEANTTAIGLDELNERSIIPVFAKDNHPTISHVEFIETVYQMAEFIFNGEKILQPSIRVSHPIKGRIPEAKHKAAKDLLEHEKTIYYERMAFMIEIPSISDNISDNNLSLTIGGVRAYNRENLYSTKSFEKFKLFIGFKNWACCNLCISTDGFKSETKVADVKALAQEALNLIKGFNAHELHTQLDRLGNYSLSENQFAQMLGKSRLYNYLPNKQKKEVGHFPLSDSQVNTIASDYYSDKSFSRESDGSINLWKLYNLFTGAGKSSYIDTFIDRNVGSYGFLNNLTDNIRNPNFWYLN